MTPSLRAIPLSWLVVALVASPVVAQGPSAENEGAETSRRPRSATEQEARELHDARLNLRTYDLSGETTIGVIRDLGQFIQRRSVDLTSDPEAESEVREANYLRAMAASDLLILAHTLGESGVGERIADAYGTAPLALNPQLRHDLETLARGVYAEQAHDAARALAVLAGEASFAPGDHGPRRDVLFLGKARELLAQDEAERLTTLRSIEPAPGVRVDAPLETLVEADRRIVHNLACVFETFTRIERRVQGGDPFSAVVAEDTQRTREGFIGWNVPTSPNLETVLPRLSEVPGGTTELGDVRALAFVAMDGNRAVLRWGWLPRIETDAHGPSITAPGAPILPAVRTIPLPRNLPSFPRALPELVEQVRESIPRGTEIALGATSDTPGHVLQRVLLSMRNAQAAPRNLLAQREGQLVITRIQATPGDDHEVVQAVRIRLGGHSIAIRRGPSRDVARVRTEEGWRFDWAGFERRVRPMRSAAIEWMGGVDASAVYGTVFRSGRPARAVILQLPGS